MPKMKTHRGSAKRFKRTGSGKLKRRHAFVSHMFANKSKKTKNVNYVKRQWYQLAISNVFAKWSLK
ncbi:50S ribosomal protein L35 [Listeria aquatica FSL S10-1188]|uniref:Large ribosomal subunit protein bL35 n=1 Tax=Listeria aquatica FSL S10-1188 TaxID=1265818 RepID=W7BDS9_9LIST|nr:50S ribosomal protein L35 [Listeria aquatica FSL S10-1188]